MSMDLLSETARTRPGHTKSSEGATGEPSPLFSEVGRSHALAGLRSDEEPLGDEERRGKPAHKAAEGRRPFL